MFLHAIMMPVKLQHFKNNDLEFLKIKELNILNIHMMSSFKAKQQSVTEAPYKGVMLRLGGHTAAGGLQSSGLATLPSPAGWESVRKVLGLPRPVVH